MILPHHFVNILLEPVSNLVDRQSREGLLNHDPAQHSKITGLVIPWPTGTLSLDTRWWLMHGIE